MEKSIKNPEVLKTILDAFNEILGASGDAANEVCRVYYDEEDIPKESLNAYCDCIRRNFDVIRSFLW